MSNLPLKSMQWQRQGSWEGGPITCVVAHGLIGLAGSLAGLFRSTDAGKTWARVDDALGFEAIQALAWVDAHVYAATRTGRLMRSLDTGATWQPVSTWLFGVIQCIACAVNREGICAIFVGTAAGVYRSLDAGQSWQEANFGLLDTDALCLACAPDFADSETLWLGTAQGGLYRSRNAGRSWRESGDGLADAAVGCIALSRHFTVDRTALVGLEGKGLFRSTDGGQHWEQAGLEGQDVHAILSLHTERTWLAATADGLYGCIEGSSLQWRRLPVVANVTGVALTQANDAADASTARLLGGTLDQGLACITQQVDGWQATFAAGIAAHVPPLGAAATSGTLFALDTLGSVVYSNDDGATWLDCSLDEELSEAAPKLFGTRGNEVILLLGAKHIHRWDADRAAFVALAHVPIAADDEVTVVAIDATNTLWVGSKTGQIQRRWPGSGLWETLPGPNEGLIVALQVENDRLHVAIIRSGQADQSCAELWQRPLSDHDENPWSLALALDHLAQPFACLGIHATGPNRSMALAAQNILAVASPERPPYLVDLGADIRVTAMVPLGQGWCVATNQGICVITQDQQIWGLRGRPVVGLFRGAERTYAVTLGGEIWALG